MTQTAGIERMLRERRAKLETALNRATNKTQMIVMKARVEELDAIHDALADLGAVTTRPVETDL